MKSKPAHLVYKQTEVSCGVNLLCSGREMFFFVNDSVSLWSDNVAGKPCSAGSQPGTRSIDITAK